MVDLSDEVKASMVLKFLRIPSALIIPSGTLLELDSDSGMDISTHLLLVSAVA